MDKTYLRRMGFSAICFSLLLASVLTTSALSQYIVDGQLVTGDFIYGPYGQEFEPLPGATIWLFYAGNPNPVASAVSGLDGSFYISTVEDFDVICPYLPGRNFNPVFGIPAYGGTHTTITSWIGSHHSNTYHVYVATVTPDRLYIDGVDVTFSGPSIGTKRAKTVSLEGNVALPNNPFGSLLTLTPEIPGSASYVPDDLLHLTGLVNISVSKPGWTFEPSLVQVEGSRVVMFVGTPTADANVLAVKPVDEIQQVIFEDNFDAENGGKGELNYNSLANWDLLDGTIDLIGTGLYDAYPGNGLYIDLDGSLTPQGKAGTIKTKREFSLQPGTYRLSFDLYQNPSLGGNTVWVSIGNIKEMKFTDPPLSAQEINFEVSRQTSVAITFKHEGGDWYGLYLDNVKLVRTS